MGDTWIPMKVKIGALVPIIVASILQGIKLLIVGNPGIGKTAIADATIASLPPYVVDGPEAMIIRWFLAQEQAEDVAGYPAIIDGKAEHILFGKQRKIFEILDRYVVHFLDDAGMGMTRDQTAQMQFVRGFVQGKRVPDNNRYIACTNDKTDKAGVTGMIEPFKSSFDCIYHAVVDHAYWEYWAVDSGQVRPDIIAYLNTHPQELDQFNPTTNLVNCASPRTWVSASNMLTICEKTDADEFTTKASVEGAIGSASCSQFFAFKEMLEAAVTPAIILADPTGASIPENTSIMYAVALALVNTVDDRGMAEAAFRYAKRLPMEFEALILRQCVKKNDGYRRTGEYLDYLSRNAEVTL